MVLAATPFLNIKVVNLTIFAHFVVDQFLEGYILDLKETNGSGFSLSQFCLNFIDLLFDYAVSSVFISFCDAVIITQPALKAIIECRGVMDAIYASANVLFYISIIT